jgi:hypothetical protein
MAVHSQLGLPVSQFNIATTYPTISSAVSVTHSFGRSSGSALKFDTTSTSVRIWLLNNLIRDLIRYDFPGAVPILWILQIPVLVSQKIWDAKCPGFFQVMNTFLTKHINIFPPDLTASNTVSKAFARWYCY